MNRALLLFLRANRRHLLDLLLASGVVNTLALALPLFSMLVYDKAVGNQIHDTLWSLAIGMLLVLGFEITCRVARMSLVEQAASRWDTTLDERLMRGVLAAPLARPLPVGTVLNRYRDLASAREFLSASYLLPLADLPFLLLFVVAGWFIGGPLVGIALLIGTVLWAVSALLHRVSRHHQRLADQAHGQKITRLVDTLLARDSLMGAAAGRLALDGFRQPSAAGARSSTRSRVWSQLSQQLLPVGLGLTTVALLVAGVFQVEAQALSVGGLISLSMLGGRIVGGLCALSPISSRWAEFKRALNELRSTIDLESAPLPDAATGPGEAVFARRDDPALRAEGIQVVGIQVRYPGSERRVLDGVQFKLRLGELVAVVGASAAGKSTLLKLLAGQIAPDVGQLSVAGRQVADDAQRRALAAAVACKPQDPTFLPGTVRQIVCPEAPAAADQAWSGDEAVLRSLRAVGFGRGLDSGEVGLNLAVGLAGQGLSGGQRQMLALARALHSDAGLLLLDEPTLGLDRVAQDTLIATLAALRGGGRCVVVATHTSELIRVCDRVLVLDGGRVVMDAPPARLFEAAPGVPVAPATTGAAVAARAPGQAQGQAPAHVQLAPAPGAAGRSPAPAAPAVAATTLASWPLGLALGTLFAALVAALAAPAPVMAQASATSASSSTSTSTPVFTPTRLEQLLGPPTGSVAQAATSPRGGSAPPLLAPPPQPAAQVPVAAQPRLDLLPALLDLPPVLPVLAAIGANPAADQTLTLSGAALGTARHSPEVEAAGYRLESFEQTRLAARGSLLPRMDLRLGVGRGLVQTTDPWLNLGRIDGLATARTALFDVPAILELGRQGILTGSAAEQLRDADSKALLDGGLAFLGVLQARVGLALGEQYERRLAELSRYIGERAAAGGTSPAEADRLRSRVANVRSSLADARAQLQSAVRNLERLYGPAPQALSMTGSEPIAVAADEATAVAEALRQNAELAAARIEIRAANEESRIARARFLPKLELELTHTRAKNPSGTPGLTHDTKGMVVLSINTLNGGTDLAQSRAAAARRMELEARATASERRLQLDIETAYANLQASSERFVTVREELDGNRRVVEAFQAQLVGGNRPLLDVLDAYQRHYQSQIDLTQVLVSTTQNQWRLAHLAGSLGPQLGRPGAR